MTTLMTPVEHCRRIGADGFWLRHPAGLPTHRDTWEFCPHGWGKLAFEAGPIVDWLEAGPVDVLLGDPSDEPWLLDDPYPDYRLAMADGELRIEAC